MTNVLVRTSLVAIAWLLCGCLILEDTDSTCIQTPQEIDPDEHVAGVRAGDVLEPYFGTHTGELHWETGSETRFTLDVPYEPGTPYELGNVWKCMARAVHYWANAHVTTEDGAFDDEISVSVSDDLAVTSDAQDAYDGTSETVLSFSAFPDWQWSESVPPHLGVDLERYSSSYLLFEVDWPPSDAKPSGGRVMLRGYFGMTNVSDFVQVARLSF